MTPIFKAGICGFIIALVIIFFSPVNTYFLPYLVAPLIAIYAFGLKDAKDGMLVAFAIYIFTEWILGSLNLVGLLISNETISFTADVPIVVNQILTTLFVLLAGLAGSELASKRRAATTFAPTPVPVPPLPSVPVATSDEKKFCRYCGVENKIDAVFCEKCGKKIG